MIEILAFIAEEHISSYSILFTHMTAFWTSLARVTWIYRLHFHTDKRRLVFYIASQLRKCPLTHAISLLFPEPFYERGCQEKILPPIRQPGIFFLTASPATLVVTDSLAGDALCQLSQCETLCA